MCVTQTKTRQVAPPRSKISQPETRNLYSSSSCFFPPIVFSFREHRIDVEVVALLFGRLEFRLLLGGLGGRQQGGATVGGGDRFFLGGALHLEIELDL